jgi:hypothetical protein
MKPSLLKNKKNRYKKASLQKASDTGNHKKIKRDTPTTSRRQK